MSAPGGAPGAAAPARAAVPTSRAAFLRRAGGPLLIVAASACAYFNGVYNAKESTRTADHLARRGQIDQASRSYALAAATAETVLARYPRTRWRPDALYLAGRGAAYSHACDLARTRLTEYLALPRQPTARRDRATLALASCSVDEARNAEAQRLATPLLASRDRDVATAARRVAARASIALGDMATAERLLSSLPQAEAQWELAESALDRLDYARAESLIVLRARDGDYRDAVTPALLSLWGAHRYDGFERVVNAFGDSRTRASTKIQLHLMAADLLMTSRRDDAARAHLMRAARLAVDSTTERAIGSRLTQLDLANRPTLAEVDATIRNASSRNRGSALQRRLDDNLLLLHLLELRQDFSGASLFLAGEVARDSLRAPALAHTLFTQVAASYPTSPLVPKALIAAAVVRPDSAAVYEERVKTQFASSPYAMILMGREPSDSGALSRNEQMLRQIWTVVTSIFVDSIQKLRPAGAQGPATPTGSGSAPPIPRDGDTP
ncbi:MAG TPA: hypothetical protein VFJ78_08355 [Gaiellaceae bacterium]|nr:hypothetical protein [Gaiellaceae bacterium]